MAKFKRFVETATALSALMKEDVKLGKSFLRRKKTPLTAKDNLQLSRNTKREYLKLAHRLVRLVEGAQVVKNVV